MTKQLKKWLRKATVQETRQLARMAGTSPAYLNQLANDHRVASADLGGRLEQAAADIRNRSAKHKKRLPILRRGHLVPACAACPYFERGCDGQD